MSQRSFRNDVTTGFASLPAAAVVCCVLWLVPAVAHPLTWAGLAVTGVSAWLMREWNHRCALIRVRSQLMSSAYLVLMGSFAFLHPWTPEGFVVPLFLLTCSSLFAAYQNGAAAGRAFYAFLFLGVGSFFSPPLLLLAPSLFLSMFVQLRMLSWRTFAAGVLGLLLPYWVCVARAVWEGSLATAFDFLKAGLQFRLPDYSAINLPRQLSLAFLLLLAAVSVSHFMRTSFSDKIRTRMYFYFVIVQEVVLLVVLAAYPRHFDTVFRLLTANSVPLIAHYFVLARGRRMNAWFIVVLALLAVLALYNNIVLWNWS